MHIDRQMWSLTAGVRGRVAATSGLGLAAIAAAAAQGALAAEMISRIMDGRPWSSITGLLVGEVALIALTGALIWLREVAAMWTAAGVKITLRRRLYTKLTELGPGYLERTETGKVQSTLVDGIEALEVYLGKYIPQLFVSVCGPIGILVMIALIDPLLGLIAALAIVVALTGDKVYMRLLGDRAWEHWNAYTALNATFLDSMQGMTTLKAFNASRRRGEELNQRSRDLLRATMAQMAVSLAGTGLIGMAMSLGTALTVGIGALHLANGDLSLSALLLILFLSGLCFAPLIELNAYWHQGFLGISSAVGVFEILDAAPAVTDPAPAAAYTGAIVPRLAFEGVSFGYQDGERPALDDLSFTIEPGETVALVGRSGSGKSTAVALALRFFDPRAGRVTLGGHDLREYPVAAVREQMAVVSQETWLFHGTVADNLRMARPAASDAELEAAARAANAHQFIQNLEHGYQTVVGERGLKLSGGQRQRIAIARALLKDAPILILDEATASVDAANEAAIMESLERLTHGRTTLVIAHRLSTIVNADRIVVLEQGRAVESGRHLELAGRDGAYARLVAAQQPSALGGGQA